MYTEMIVPLDGSKMAEIALPYAEEIAGRIGSNITLFSVIESEESEPYNERYHYLKKVIHMTKKHASKYDDDHSSQIPDIKSAIWPGNPPEAIVDFASKSGDKLLIMATHGRSGLGRWAMGSVVDKVVHTAFRQPVMIIRAKENRADVREKRILRRVLIPLDGSRRSRAIIPLISDLLIKLDVELTLLQVTSSNGNAASTAKEYLQKECEKIKAAGINANYEVIIGPSANTIIDCADELAIDLVAMSTRGINGIGSWPLGSVSQKVLLAGNTPLLLLKVQ